MFTSTLYGCTHLPTSLLSRLMLSTAMITTKFQARQNLTYRRAHHCKRPHIENRTNLMYAERYSPEGERMYPNDLRVAKQRFSKRRRAGRSPHEQLRVTLFRSASDFEIRRGETLTVSDSTSSLLPPGLSTQSRYFFPLTGSSGSSANTVLYMSIANTSAYVFLHATIGIRGGKAAWTRWAYP
jgi:hypothetical protein